MNPATILPAILTASTLSVIAGFGYIVDCRANGGAVDACWLTGLPIAGLGGAGAGAFKVGFETLNPRLRRKDEA